MKNAVKLVAGSLTGLLVAGSSFAASVFPYASVGTSIGDEFTAASGALIMPLITVAMGFVGFKLVRRFIAKV